MNVFWAEMWHDLTYITLQSLKYFMGIQDGKSQTSEEVMSQENKELIGDITENAFSAVVWAKPGKTGWTVSEPKCGMWCMFALTILRGVLLK